MHRACIIFCRTCGPFLVTSIQHLADTPTRSAFFLHRPFFSCQHLRFLFHNQEHGSWITHKVCLSWSCYLLHRYRAWKGTDMWPHQAWSSPPWRTSNSLPGCSALFQVLKPTAVALLLCAQGEENFCLHRSPWLGVQSPVVTVSSLRRDLLLPSTGRRMNFFFPIYRSRGWLTIFTSLHD